MKITQNLPQFDNDVVLIVVTGKQEAKFYLAQDGEIERIADFELETPHYSDREGAVVRGGSGRRGQGRFATGLAATHQKEKMHNDFLKTCKEHLAKILPTIKATKLYLFSPSYVGKDVMELFPANVQKNTKWIAKGIYISKHP